MTPEVLPSFLFSLNFAITGVIQDTSPVLDDAAIPTFRHEYHSLRFLIFFDSVVITKDYFELGAIKISAKYISRTCIGHQPHRFA